MDPNKRFRQAIYEQFARIGKAISSPRRLELLELLSQAERTVEALAEQTGLTIANTSQHLQVLRSARLVESEKNGQFVSYRLADQTVDSFLRTMRRLAEDRLAEVEQITKQFLQGREGMQPVSREFLLEGVRTGTVTVLDVRPAEEYRAGHIRGAVSIPMKELEKRLSELPKNQEIVAYCRGRYCVLAVKAVEILRAKGFKVLRLEDGVQDWREQGYPVSVGQESEDTIQGPRKI